MSKWEQLSKTYNTKDIIFKQGSPSGTVFVVREGVVQLTRIIEGNRILVDELLKGEMFGVPSTLLDVPRLYTAIAGEDNTVVVELMPNVFNDIVNKTPEIAFMILKKMSLRIFDVENLISSIKFPSTDTKELEKKKGELDMIPSSMEVSILILKTQRKAMIQKTKAVIGRKVLSLNYEPEIDLSEEDEGRYISRKHAMIFYDQNEFFIKEELGVINGTYLNGEKLKSGVPYKLKNGDLIKFCNIEAIFQIEQKS
jgi:CRP-like cAMP-binding protein